MITHLAPCLCIASITIFLPCVHADERTRELEMQCLDIDNRLDVLRKKLGENSDQVADAAIYTKALHWALKYDSSFTDGDIALQRQAIEQGKLRTTQLEADDCRWSSKKGKLVRAFVSKVDGSVQPYGLVIPSSYDPQKPIRLDVVLHGSSKPVGMSELRFMGRFEATQTDIAPEADFIELHPLGRVENCYRWSGETDVFEAIEAACRNYNIDRDRIVLRGMSMGASGTWHLGLKHPDQFVALGPYCGYVDTYQFSNTPLPNFIKVEKLPEHQERALHMLDSIDYAANASTVPAIACMGEKDVFFQAHVLMEQAMNREGLKMINLISPGTGHVMDPVTHQEQMRQIAEHVNHGLDHYPKRLRFVTWTLKYNRCHWIELLQLQQHYSRSEIKAAVNDDESIDVDEPLNVTQFAIHAPALQSPSAKLRIAGTEIVVAPRSDSLSSKTVILTKSGNNWRADVAESVDQFASKSSVQKRSGLQGPIDDAFTTKFLCVRGTGRSMRPDVQKWCDDRLAQFQKDWHRYFRGELPLKNDVDVTEEDLRSSNLVLFGDTTSNLWIAKLLPKLPLKWTDKSIEMQGLNVSSTEHVPVLIYPNPLSANRYVVLNCGHTFGDAELGALNYLLFPRLGDWSVFNVGTSQSIQSGFFNDQWR